MSREAGSPVRTSPIWREATYRIDCTSVGNFHEPTGIFRVVVLGLRRRHDRTLGGFSRKAECQALLAKVAADRHTNGCRAEPALSNEYRGPVAWQTS